MDVHFFIWCSLLVIIPALDWSHKRDVSSLSLEKLDRKIADLVKVLNEKDRRVEEIERKMTERDHKIGNLIENVLEKDRKIEELSNRLHKQENTIRMLENNESERRIETKHFKEKQKENTLDINELYGKFRQLCEEIQGLMKNVRQDREDRKLEDKHAKSEQRYKKHRKNNKNVPLGRRNDPVSLSDAVPQDHPYSGSELEVRGSLSVRSSSEPFRRQQSRSAVAFYAYISSPEPSPSRHHIIVFYLVVTNAGKGYNGYTGVFTAPLSGVYHFSWTIYNGCHAFTFIEILKNNDVMGASFVDGDDICDTHSSTGNANIGLVDGDVVFIRTSSSSDSKGSINSGGQFRSAFSGFLII